MMFGAGQLLGTLKLSSAIIIVLNQNIFISAIGSGIFPLMLGYVGSLQGNLVFSISLFIIFLIGGCQASFMSLTTQ
ncbi:MAG: hypothetical protein CM1200mP33_2880 [Chloroflexota bacterium]|nr:MAG: hypothetical protein CM1200mP33_2880 [Chloroflexota bacterium]